MDKEIEFELCTEFLGEFYFITEIERAKILDTINKRLGAFPEATDINAITDNCIADIERLITDQFCSDESQWFNNNEKQRKLTLFQRDSGYVRQYVFEAIKSFCRKMQHNWTKARAISVSVETDNAPKTEQVIVDDESLNTWLAQIASSNLRVTDLAEATINALHTLFRRKRFNDKKIRCFFDRLDGMSFVEMSENDPDINATPDKHRKRYKRMLMQLKRNEEELRNILLSECDF